MAASRPIKVAVMGLGRAGWNIHVRRMREDKRFVVTSVMDSLRERREQAAEELGCAAFGTRKSLLDKTDAELVVNALPSHLHAPVSIDIMRSGRHCLVEKPVARTTTECRRMIRAQKSTGKLLFVHQNRRFSPEHKHFTEVIDSGILGRVFEIKVILSSFSRRNDWQTLKKNNGGVLYNTGSHTVDSVLQLLGSPVADIWGDTKLISDSGDAEDHAHVIVRAKSGCIADILVTTSCNADFPFWTICGTCGTLVSDGRSSTIKYFDPQRVKPLPVEPSAPPDRTYGNADKLPWTEKTVPTPSRDSYDLYDNVHDVLRRRGKMVVTPESVLEALRVMETAKKRFQVWRPEYGKARKQRTKAK